VSIYHEAWISLSTEPVWPTTILSHLRRLVSFDIRVPPQYTTVDVIGLNLRVLPPTLTHLGFGKAKFCLNTQLQSSPSDHGNNTLARLFPTLRTLRTSGDPEILHKVPETLATIWITARQYPHFELSPHITDLRISFYIKHHEDKFPPLPPLLTRLRFDSKLSDPRCLLPFPSTLRSLYFEDMETNSWVTNLPKDLTSLSLGISMRAVAPSDIALLPRTLKSLLLRGQYWGASKLNDANLKDLPPQLTELDVSSECTHLSGFPETLTKLNIRGSVDAIGGIEHLPRGLVALGLSSIDSLTNAAIAQLPTKLTSLKLPQAVRIHSIAGLPHTITVLKLYNVTDAEALILPPTLTVLILENEYMRTMAPRITAKGVPLLPDSIKTLKLAVQVTDQHLQPQQQGEPHFKWPRSLRSLTLSHLSSITDSAIALLPATVSSLVIPGNGPSGSCFATLPPRLIEFVILSEIPMAAEDLQHLPGTIALLEMWSKPMNDTWVSKLPRLLTSIYLHRTTVTEPVIRSHCRYVDIVQLFGSTEFRS